MCNFGTLVSTAPLFRRAFPCFDEPSFKSTFRITIVRPTDGYIALSNMPEEESFPDKPDVGLTEVRFQVGSNLEEGNLALLSPTCLKVVFLFD